MSTPAGWYPEQTGGRLRWWDGAQWTDHFQDAVAVTTPQDVPPGTIWHAVGRPLTGIGVGRYRLTTTFLFFEKGTLSLNAQQIPVAEVHDVDARQSMTQKARSVGSITLRVHRASGVEMVVIEDIPNFREGVQAINHASHEARVAIQQRSQTQTINHHGGYTHQSVPAAVTAPAAPDVIAQLRQLGELRDAGVVTTEEFEAKKTQMLARL